MGKFTHAASITITHNSLFEPQPDHSESESLHALESADSRDVQEETRQAGTDAGSDIEQQLPPTQEEEQVLFEPLDKNPYDLSYTCLLIPRFNSHFLSGDLAIRLPEWMQQICISFGWRLELIRVKPDYMQWILRVPPATSTAYFMRVIRHQTSLLVFEDFPRLRHENLAKDFWAPGYLVYFGSQLHSPDVIRDFIRQTRQQQGILPNG